MVNPFADPEFTAGYETWYETVGRRADRLEKALLARLLDRFPGACNILEVGCGTGHFSRWMASRGLHVVGLDSSPAMLTEAQRLGTPHCLCGDARVLPFPAGYFDLVLLVTTLEFMPEPEQALAETLRVARRGLVLGVLERRSRLARELLRGGELIWDAARFYTPRELKGVVRRALAGRPARIVWRTTLWRFWPRELPVAGGGFIGMAVQLTQGEGT